MTYIREAGVERLFTQRAEERGWAVRKVAWVNRHGSCNRPPAR